MKKTAFILFALNLFLSITLSARTPIPEKLIKRPLGDYYVSVLTPFDTFGDGLDEVFPVSIACIHPKTEAELNALRNFDYMRGIPKGQKPPSSGNDSDKTETSKDAPLIHYEWKKSVPFTGYSNSVKAGRSPLSSLFCVSRQPSGL